MSPLLTELVVESRGAHVLHSRPSMLQCIILAALVLCTQSSMLEEPTTFHMLQGEKEEVWIVSSDLPHYGCCVSNFIR